MKVVHKNTVKILAQSCKIFPNLSQVCFSSNVKSSRLSEYEVVIAGGGAGGVATGARLSKLLGKGKVLIIDRAVVTIMIFYFSISILTDAKLCF